MEKPSSRPTTDGATPSCSYFHTLSGIPDEKGLRRKLPGRLEAEAAHFTFAVDGKNIGSWAAAQSLPTSLPHGDNSTRFTLPPVELHTGDTLRVAATPNGHRPRSQPLITEN